MAGGQTDPSSWGYRVMADTGSSGIWRMEPYAAPGTSIVFRHRMTSFSQLNLSPDLVARFKAWIAEYESGLRDLEQFNRTGLELAQALKAVLGSRVHVEYEPEWVRGGDRPAATVID